MNNMEITSRKKKLAILTILTIIIGLTFSNIYLASQVTEYRRDADLALEIESGYCAHINVYLQRAGSDVIETIKDGVLLNNAGTITTIGLNYIEGKLGDSGYGDNAKFADDISLSSNVTGPAAAWTIIPAEIAADGLDRVSATYASTGNGVWTITNQFTASGAVVAVQLTGLNWDATDELDDVLLCADTFAAVTLANGDKLTVTWTITVT